MECTMGLKRFDPDEPFGLITGDGTEGRYVQGGIVFGADGLPLHPEEDTDTPADDPPTERRKKS